MVLGEIIAALVKMQAHVLAHLDHVRLLLIAFGRLWQMIQIAADQQQHVCRGVGDLSLVTGDGARKHVVDHHRRNRGNQAQRRCQQGLGDAGGNDGEVGGLGFGDADEAVHDAPHGAEQTHERRRRTDGCQHAGAHAHVTATGCYQALEAEADTLLDPFAFTAVGRKAHFFKRVVHQQVGKRAFLAGGCAGFCQGAGFFQVDDFTAQPALGAQQLETLGDPDGPRNDRGDGQPDHDDLHDDVGVLIHAPRRQVMCHAQAVVFSHWLQRLNRCGGVRCNRSRCRWSGGGCRGGGRWRRLIRECHGHEHQAQDKGCNTTPCTRQARQLGRRSD
ncbi:hypothetical protein ALQ24_102338 [Pseudomonas syringae pv. antirrhini]|nr:hypothetical protein ALQ24_102338 [Pseudomonas syringae pv. antirrhini]